jgi:(R,R)-butanediol dehydrogenase/meso-butanediol dehydrogenase/diacetyl reductase
VKAARFYGRRELRIEEVEEPVAGPGEVLLEVHAAGVCGTDAAEWADGPIQYAVAGRHPLTGHEGPLTPGHEFSGRVVAVGDGVDTPQPGAVVACGAGYTVREDAAVAAGRPNLSRYYVTLGLHKNGGLAQYVAAPASICLDVQPYRLSEDAAALAQPMSIAVHALRRARPRPGEDALVIGIGGIGAFLTYAAGEAGLRVVAVDLDPGRVAVAERLGAHAVVDAREHPDLRRVLADIGVRPTLAYEATGSGTALSGALDVLEKSGRLVLVGLHEQPRELDLRRVTLRELELLGTSAHVFVDDLPEALRVLATRRESWADVAPTAVPLEHVVDEALSPLAEGRSSRIKTLVDPWAVEPRPTQMAAEEAEAVAP